MDRWKEALRRAGISEAVYEGQKLHSQYRFHVDDFGLIVGVRVWETTDGQYMGDCEYSVKGPSQRDYYRDVHFYSTADQALAMAVSAFITICKPPFQGVSLHNEWQQEVADKLQLEYEITQEKTLDE